MMTRKQSFFFGLDQDMQKNTRVVGRVINCKSMYYAIARKEREQTHSFRFKMAIIYFSDGNNFFHSKLQVTGRKNARK